MGYDLYFSKKDAAKVGIQIKKVREVEIDQSYINEDGFWVEENPLIAPIYNVSVNGKLVHTTNLHIQGDEVSWRSSSFKNPEENGGEYDDEPTIFIKKSIPFQESH